MKQQPRLFPPSYYEDPGFVEYFQRMFVSLNEFAFSFEKYPVDYGFVWRMLTSAKIVDAIWVLALAVTFTCMRQSVTITISNPLASRFRVSRANRQKWSESIWKFFAYSALWLYTLYVTIISGKYQFFYKPVDILRDIVFDDDFLSRQVPTDITWLYRLQLGFYLHSIFATIYMDLWRKDSVMMLLHHCLTIFLLEFSLLMKFYKAGTLVLLLHDISDVILEFTKLNVYMKISGSRFERLHEWLANFGFVVFAFSWAWLRLYWFPTKILYATNWGVYVYHKDKDPKMFLFFNLMLFTLQALHIWWFYFVILLLVRVATGRQREVDDTREYDDAARRRRDD